MQRGVADLCCKVPPWKDVVIECRVIIDGPWLLCMCSCLGALAAATCMGETMCFDLMRRYHMSGCTASVWQYIWQLSALLAPRNEPSEARLPPHEAPNNLAEEQDCVVVILRASLEV